MYWPQKKGQETVCRLSEVLFKGRKIAKNHWFERCPNVLTLVKKNKWKIKGSASNIASYFMRGYVQALEGFPRIQNGVSDLSASLGVWSETVKRTWRVIYKSALIESWPSTTNCTNIIFNCLFRAGNEGITWGVLFLAHWKKQQCQLDCKVLLTLFLLINADDGLDFLQFIQHNHLTRSSDFCCSICRGVGGSFG